MKALFIVLAGTSLSLAKPLPLEVVKNTAREIDEVLIAGQQKLGIKANPVADDATFLRRSYLNIIGRLPTHDEARAFLTLEEVEKRTQLVDSLVASPGFSSRLFHFWADLLRVQTSPEHHSLGWHVWLRKAVEDSMPYDKMVAEMLSAEGHAAENPAVGYYLRDRGMLLDNVSNTVEVFLGQQIGCAQCHDHPFDDTTQMEYYQLAAFLGGTSYGFEEGRAKIRETVGLGFQDRPRKRPGKMTLAERKAFRDFLSERKERKGQARALGQVFRFHNRNALSDQPRRSLKLPTDYSYEDGTPGETVKPGFLFGLETKEVAPEKRRVYFAKWVTSPKNPYFTKVIANRMWDYVFGYGLVANPSDWENSPKPHYPELIAYLESAMKATDYDLKEFLRILYHTQLFQREMTVEAPAPGFSFHFQGPALRRMSAEEIRDSFVTLAAGNIDSNFNPTYQEAWTDYVGAFQQLMQTEAKDLRRISTAVTQNEKQRRVLQKEVSLLRAKAQKAQATGDLPAARATFREIKALQRSYRQSYRRGVGGTDDPALAKVAPALGRRPNIKRPETPFFKMRASELPLPAKGGTFIAEFGGSDAESPSAAHTNATVPQSLRLLNGLETSLLTNRRNAFARGLRAQPDATARLDFLFISLYSAFPTDAEKEAFLPETKTAAAAETLARAILTSNRFLFVQ